MCDIVSGVKLATPRLFEWPAVLHLSISDIKTKKLIAHRM